ncbi:GLUG motif-containing protein, partial [Oscillibacter sp.]|uniref:GLUG motif-containing protein n=1 Tax=Oscillibacter sp. TaxID=1945593 RepID=UPI0037C6543E
MKQVGNRIFSLALSLCILITLMPQLTLPAKADETDASANTMENLYTAVVTNGGAAPESGIYTISSTDELHRLAAYVNAGNTAAGVTFQLAGNLDVNPGFTFNSDGTYTGDGTLDPWTPIGNESHIFSGTFDGNGNTIRGLYISTYDDYHGLFGYVGEKGTIKNLEIGSGNLRGSNYVSGIAGNNDGTITNCSNGTVIYGDKYVGGIAGYNVGTITNCSNSVFVGGDTTNIGGIVGNCNHEGTISNSYNTGNVRGGRSTGGIVGYNNSCTVSNNYNTGKVQGSYYIGGITGYSKLSTINNNYNTGDIYAGSSYDHGSAGGIVGYCHSGTLNNNYNAGDVSGDSTHIGGIVGHRYAGYVRYCYWLKTSDICSKLDATGYGTSTGCGYVATSDGNIIWVDNSDDTVVTGDHVTLQNALNAWVKEYKNESSYDTWTVTSENNGFPVLSAPWVSTL